MEDFIFAPARSWRAGRDRFAEHRGPDVTRARSEGRRTSDSKRPKSFSQAHAKRSRSQHLDDLERGDVERSVSGPVTAQEGSASSTRGQTANNVLNTYLGGTSMQPRAPIFGRGRGYPLSGAQSFDRYERPKYEQQRRATVQEPHQSYQQYPDSSFFPEDFWTGKARPRRHCDEREEPTLSYEHEPRSSVREQLDRALEQNERDLERLRSERRQIFTRRGREHQVADNDPQEQPEARSVQGHGPRAPYYPPYVEEEAIEEPLSLGVHSAAYGASSNYAEVASPPPSRPATYPSVPTSDSFAHVDCAGRPPNQPPPTNPGRPYNNDSSSSERELTNYESFSRPPPRYYPPEPSYFRRPPKTKGAEYFWTRAADYGSPLKTSIRIILTRNGQRCIGDVLFPFSASYETQDDRRLARHITAAYADLKRRQLGCAQRIFVFKLITYVRVIQYRCLVLTPPSPQQPPKSPSLFPHRHARRPITGEWVTCDIVNITSRCDAEGREAFQFQLQHPASLRGQQVWSDTIRNCMVQGSCIDLEIIEAVDAVRIYWIFIVSALLSLVVGAVYAVARKYDFATGFSIAGWMITAFGFFATVLLAGDYFGFDDKKKELDKATNGQIAGPGSDEGL